MTTDTKRALETIVLSNQKETIDLTDEERIDQTAQALLHRYREALEELAK